MDLIQQDIRALRQREGIQKMHLKETLGLEKLKINFKKESSAFKQEEDSAWGAVHPRCEWRRREQAQGGNFMPGLTL